MTKDNEIIALNTHPKWRLKHAQKSDQTPEFIQGTIHAIQPDDINPLYKYITVSLTDETQYTALFNPHIDPETTQIVERAYLHEHELRLGLKRNENGTPTIQTGTDISETMLLNGPFGKDRIYSLDTNGDTSVKDFLSTAGAPYRLTRSHVAKLWTWPLAEFPELTDNLTSFVTIPPKEIGTTQQERTGMAGAIILGMAEEMYGTPNSVVRRLKSVQGRWDKVGAILGDDGTNQIFESIHQHLPTLTGLAAGSAGATDNDITLPTRTNAVWENVGPTMVTAFSTGKIQDVYNRSKTLDALMAQSTFLLENPQSAAKEGWKEPEKANAFIERVGKDVFEKKIDRAQAASLFLGKMTPRSPTKSNRER